MIVKQTLEEVYDYLESWDVEPTEEYIKRILNKWIKNLYSHVGVTAHEHSLSCGIEDNTGMTWEEQDAQTLQQIDRYKKCLAMLELSPQYTRVFCMDKYVNLYTDKWEQWVVDNNISETDERSFTWGWQFDNGCDFIDSPEILLGCYICSYGREDAENYLREHFTNDNPFYEMAQKALKLMKRCA